MTNLLKKLNLLPVALMALLLCDSAHALRCGNKLVKEGMLEEHIKAICGEPSSTRTLGLVLRYYDPYEDGRGIGRYDRYYGYAARRELPVTEMVFNFGPHKLMRIMRFEGGRLVSIQTAGYGYREQK